VVALEVDGRPWRAVPEDVVLRAGLVCGMELDRAVLRRLRTELRRSRGFAVAGAALARRDLSLASLRRRLEQGGIPPATASDVVRTLIEAGVADDARLARRRAAELAGRGYGDAAIAARLDGEGIEAAAASQALALLEEEPVRARRLLANERDAPRAARKLVRRGFAPEVIEDVAGALDAEARRGLP
jgi:SOS response regulatory protein OraA/RecX